MFRKITAATALITTLVLPTSSLALTLTGSYYFDGSVFTDPGLVVNSSHGIGAVKRQHFEWDLVHGQTMHTTLARVWTDETWVNWDDKHKQDLNFHFDGKVAATQAARWAAQSQAARLGDPSCSALSDGAYWIGSTTGNSR